MEYQLDSHTHTLASGHAYNTIMEMAKAAADKGLKFLGITDHAPKMPESCGAFYFSNLSVVDRELYGVELALGVELNIIDDKGEVDLSEHLLKQMDICIASLHAPCIRPGTMKENTNAVVNTMKNPYVNIIGHPDDGRYPLDYKKVVKAAKKHHVLLEVNNSSLNPEGFRLNTHENDTIMLKLCMEYEQPVVIGSDAHWMSQVGTHDRAKSLIDEIEFPYDLVMNYHLEEFKKYINK